VEVTILIAKGGGIEMVNGSEFESPPFSLMSQNDIKKKEKGKRVEGQ